MRLPLLVALVVLSAVPSLAQQRHSKARHVDADMQQCVDVEIGGKRLAYNCLNQRLRRQVDRNQANPYAGRQAAPLDAGSPPHKIGIVTPTPHMHRAPFVPRR